jgi:Glutamate synthase central domain
VLAGLDAEDTTMVMEVNASVGVLAGLGAEDAAMVMDVNASVCDLAGLGAEDTTMVIEGMAQLGAEPTYCMGDDIPLPVLSERAHMIYDYFKQRFAQARARCAFRSSAHLALKGSRFPFFLPARAGVQGLGS